MGHEARLATIVATAIMPSPHSARNVTYGKPCLASVDFPDSETSAQTSEKSYLASAGSELFIDLQSFVQDTRCACNPK
jgi:hypothetical protein